MFFKKKSDPVMVFPIERSKKTAIPLFAETGGMSAGIGSANLIGNSSGLPRKAVYVWNGRNPLGKHALIPARVGDVVVQASVADGHESATIGIVDRIDMNTLEAGIIATIKDRVWSDIGMAGQYRQIAEAALSKAKTELCDMPVYCIPVDYRHT